MFPFWLRFSLFVSSYFPAFLIIAILYRTRNPWVSVATLAIGLGGCAVLWAALRHLRSLIPQRFEVERVEPQDTEAMTYVVSYVIPFLFGVLEGPDSALAFAVFFVVIGILYANSNLIHINPMLNIVGYRIDKIELGDRSVVTLLSRRRTLPGTTVEAVTPGSGIFLDLGPATGGPAKGATRGGAT